MHLFFFLLLACAFQTANAQTAGEEPAAIPDTIQRVVQRFRTLNSQYPQEKVYLHHDKSFYAAGDDIWFRAYLVNATTHVPNRLSRLLYVELLNQNDTILYKEKIVRQQETEFIGDIHLPDTLRPGYYRVRAYTNFMRNAGDDFFFNERIYVGNSRTYSIQPSVVWKTDASGNAEAVVTLCDMSGKPLEKTDAQYVLNLRAKSTKKVKTDANGTFTVSFKQKDMQDENSLQISADVNGTSFRRTFRIPSLSEDVDVQFFPEGGSLLQGKSGSVAFKAVDANGFGKEIQGSVRDKNGEEVATFASNSLGMGRFTMPVDKDMTYYADVKAGAFTKRVDLPAPLASGIVLNLGQNASRVTLMVQATDDLASSDNQWLLVMHSRGSLLNALMLSKEQIGIPMPINKNQLPSGIITFTLFGKQGPVSERMIFVDNPLDQLSIKITPGKPSYQARDRVSFMVKVSDAKGNPVQTNLSLAVTDDAVANPQDMQSTIFSNLLLTSDLKGYIETPHYYFSDSTGIRTADLDCLMMTQGWTRFSTEDVVHGRFPDLTFPLELSSTISGTVRSLTGIARNASMSLLPSGDIAQIKVTTSDEKGRFEFSGFEYPDSTKYVIQARSSGGASNMFVFLDSDHVPVKQFRSPVPDKEDLPEFQESLKRSYDQFVYDAEARMLMLEGVEVEARAVIPKTGDALIDMITGSMSWYSPNYMDAEKISQYPGYTFWQLLDLCALANVSEDEERIEIRAGRSNPLILVDGFARDLDYVESFVRPDEIATMIIIKDGNEAAFWGNYAFKNGAIYITMKRGSRNEEADAPGVFVVTPLGFHVAKEFYVPNYAVKDEKTAKIPDNRTTIFWDANVATDQTGTAIVAFYASDAPTTYSVVAETVSSGGFIGRGTASINRQ